PVRGKPVAVEGDLSAAGMRFAIVVARWNAVVTDRLLEAALDALLRSGARRNDIEVVRVPGTWEIPSAARAIANQGKVDAIVTLGCLLRGGTAHYEAIYNEVARGSANRSRRREFHTASACLPAKPSSRPSTALASRAATRDL